MFLYLLEACKVLLTTFGGGAGAGAEFRHDNVVAEDHNNQTERKRMITATQCCHNWASNSNENPHSSNNASKSETSKFRQHNTK